MAIGAGVSPAARAGSSSSTTGSSRAGPLKYILLKNILEKKGAEPGRYVLSAIGRLDMRGRWLRRRIVVHWMLFACLGLAIAIHDEECMHSIQGLPQDSLQQGDMKVSSDARRSTGLPQGYSTQTPIPNESESYAHARGAIFWTGCISTPVRWVNRQITNTIKNMLPMMERLRHPPSSLNAGDRTAEGDWLLVSPWLLISKCKNLL
jgi:hypothetical protein